MSTEQAMAVIYRWVRTDVRYRILAEVWRTEVGMRFQAQNGETFDYAASEGYGDLSLEGPTW